PPRSRPTTSERTKPDLGFRPWWPPRPSSARPRGPAPPTACGRTTPSSCAARWPSAARTPAAAPWRSSTRPCAGRRRRKGSPSSRRCETDPAMRFVADLHIHSKHSRACSKDCDLEHLAWWAGHKGIAVVGTGDFTHPGWVEELRGKLRPAEPGLFRLQPEVEQGIWDRLPPACRTPVRFMLSSEISTIYKRDDRTRKVHHLLYAADFEAVDRITTRLARIGNLTADGRPILGLDSRDLLEITLESGDDSYLVPAHAWTPWFAVLGSQSGFDAVDDCYADLAEHVFAVETGLSSDPEMNWRVSSLD